MSLELAVVQMDIAVITAVVASLEVDVEKLSPARESFPFLAFPVNESPGKPKKGRCILHFLPFHLSNSPFVEERIHLGKWLYLMNEIAQNK
jgi:hypothetical protein